MNDPEGMLSLLAERPPSFSLAVYPTAGNPQRKEDRLVYKTTPEMFGQGAREIAARGARLIGGCCGTTPAHIAAISAAVAVR
jgi:homocysteine S-methyltransferase